MRFEPSPIKKTVSQINSQTVQPRQRPEIPIIFHRLQVYYHSQFTNLIILMHFCVIFYFFWVNFATENNNTQSYGKYQLV